MDRPDRFQEDLLDSAVLRGEAELEKLQDGVGIEGDESGEKAHPAQVTGHEITPEWLNLGLCVSSVVAVGMILLRNEKEKPQVYTELLFSDVIVSLW